MSTYDFSLFTTLPYNIIKEKLTEIIEHTFNREGSLHFTSEQPKGYNLWPCQKVCNALHDLLDYTFIRFGSKLYRQIVGIPMGSNCAPFVADYFLFRSEGIYFSDNNQFDVIEEFNSLSRYLNGFLNNINPYFEQMVGQIYSTALQLNNANSFDTRSPSLDLSIIKNGIVSSKIYENWDDYNFEIVNSPFLGGNVPR